MCVCANAQVCILDSVYLNITLHTVCANKHFKAELACPGVFSPGKPRRAAVSTVKTREERERRRKKTQKAESHCLKHKVCHVQSASIDAHLLGVGDCSRNVKCAYNIKDCLRHLNIFICSLRMAFVKHRLTCKQDCY